MHWITRAAVNCTFAYHHAFVWVKVQALYFSHPWSDDKVLVLTHCGCIAKRRDYYFKRLTRHVNQLWHQNYISEADHVVVLFYLVIFLVCVLCLFIYCLLSHCICDQCALQMEALSGQFLPDTETYWGMSYSVHIRGPTGKGPKERVGLNWSKWLFAGKWRVLH